MSQKILLKKRNLEKFRTKINKVVRRQRAKR